MAKTNYEIHIFRDVDGALRWKLFDIKLNADVVTSHGYASPAKRANVVKPLAAALKCEIKTKKIKVPVTAGTKSDTALAKVDVAVKNAPLGDDAEVKEDEGSDEEDGCPNDDDPGDES